MIASLDSDLLIAKKTVNLGQKFSSPKLIILMGLPGSGKSYVSQYLHQKHGFTVLSGENVTYALFGTTSCSADQYSHAYNILRQLASNLLSEGYSIVIDGTNLKYVFRQQIYQEVKSNSTTLLYLKVDDNTALNRIKNRGVDSSDPSNIKSSITPEVFNQYKSQLEEPLDSENTIVLNSDDSIYRQLDSILFNN